MNIQFEIGDENHEIASFLYEKNNEPGAFCHCCPKNQEEIEKELERIFYKKDTRLLVLRDSGNVIQGVFWLVEITEEKYLEMDWGLCTGHACV